MTFLPRALLAALSLLSLACSAQTAAPAFAEGTHYKKVREVTAPMDPKRITVEEFFWYGCGHCYAFEPTLEKWAKRKSGDVDFIRVPNSLGRPVGELHSKTFYAMDSMKLLEKGHLALFRAMHEQRRHLETDAAIGSFVSEATGVMPDVFAGTLNGFAVDSQVRRAEALARQYGISSTPTLVVGGRYIVNATTAGGFEGMIKVTDFLTDKIRAERKGK